MKKRLAIVFSVLLVASGGIYLLRGQLWKGMKNALTADMKIVGKVFVDGYEERVSATAVFAYATGLLDQG